MLLLDATLAARALEAEPWANTVTRAPAHTIAWYLERKVVSNDDHNPVILAIRETVSALGSMLGQAFSDLQRGRLVRGLCQIATECLKPCKPGWRNFIRPAPAESLDRRTEGLITNILIAALYLNQESLLHELLQTPNLDLNRHTNVFGRPIDTAARTGNDTALTLLNHHGASLFQVIDDPEQIPTQLQEGHQISPLKHAASGGHKSTVELLAQTLLQHAEIKVTQRDFGDAILCATKRGHDSIVSYLLENYPGGHAQYFSLSTVSSTKRCSGLSLIVIHASKAGHTRLVQYAKEKSARAKFRSPRNDGARHAAIRGHGQTLRVLLEYAATNNLQKEIKEKWRLSSVLGQIGKNGHVHTLAMLLDYSGVDINCNLICRHAFLGAAKCGWIDVMRELIRRGIELADPDIPNNRPTLGEEALRLAAGAGQESVVDLLIAHGVRRLGGAMKMAEREGQYKMMRHLSSKIDSGDIAIAFYAGQNMSKEDFDQALIESRYPTCRAVWLDNVFIFERRGLWARRVRNT